MGDGRGASGDSGSIYFHARRKKNSLTPTPPLPCLVVRRKKKMPKQKKSKSTDRASPYGNIIQVGVAWLGVFFFLELVVAVVVFCRWRRPPVRRCHLNDCYQRSERMGSAGWPKRPGIKPLGNAAAGVCHGLLREKKYNSAPRWKMSLACLCPHPSYFCSSLPPLHHPPQARPKNFGIGQAVQHPRDLTRFVKWPKYVRIQRQRRVLNKRLRVPPSINQVCVACLSTLVGEGLSNLETGEEGRLFFFFFFFFFFFWLLTVLFFFSQLCHG